MQPGNRLHKAQAQPVSRLGPALLQPDKAVQNTPAILFFNAPPVVSDAYGDPVMLLFEL